MSELFGSFPQQQSASGQEIKGEEQPRPATRGEDNPALVKAVVQKELIRRYFERKYSRAPSSKDELNRVASEWAADGDSPAKKFGDYVDTLPQGEKLNGADLSNDALDALLLRCGITIPEIQH